MGISVREFAKRDGCSHSVVLRAIKEGRLKKLPDDTLDEALVGSGWRPTNRRKAAESKGSAPASSKKSKTIEVSDLASIEVRKEFYLSEIRRLEYETKAGMLVPIDEVNAVWGEKISRIRTRLMALPSEIAPEFQRSKTVAEAEKLIRRQIIAALEELSHDGDDE